MLRGRVHDPTARRMGGAAGHAGLFGTARDLARFCAMLLGGGAGGGVRLLAPLSVARMTRVSTPPHLADRRGLGWDVDSRYSSNRGDLFPIGSYGHTGFTGTSLWIDPATQTFVVFLSNRVHPSGGGDVTALRGQVAEPSSPRPWSTCRPLTGNRPARSAPRNRRFLSPNAAELPDLRRPAPPLTCTRCADVRAVPAGSVRRPGASRRRGLGGADVRAVRAGPAPGRRGGAAAAASRATLAADGRGAGARATRRGGRGGRLTRAPGSGRAPGSRGSRPRQRR